MEADSVLAVMLRDVIDGHGTVMEEGIRYNAHCDGKNHYLYKRDTKAINPKTGHGYSKGRIYVGTLEACRSQSPAYCEQWEGKHRHGSGHGRASAGHGRPETDSLSEREGVTEQSLAERLFATARPSD